MDITPRPATAPSTTRSALRRGLGAAGAALVAAFVGTAGLGVSQAHAAGISTGLSYAAAPVPRAPHPPHRFANHPANLPAATTTAYRYSFRDGQLIQL